jgi:inosine-uridine nucleoside N-ribohydrolase
VTRLVIDTDPGVDDAHAIMMAFAHPATRVEAVTTVAGNVQVEKTTANASLVLDVLGVSPDLTPIYRGAECALLRSRHEGSSYHGRDGLGNSNYPRSSRPIGAEQGALALSRLGKESPGELTLVALGPLTNLALAIRLDPKLPGNYNRLVVMGGAIRGTGNNHANPSAEFNVYSDPEAAAIVFENWPGLTLVSWETTMAHMLSYEQMEVLMQGQTKRAEFFRRITAWQLEYCRETLRRPGFFTPDELAVAVAIAPDIVKSAEAHAVSVELWGNHTRGQTTVDWFDMTGGLRNVNVVLEIDKERFWQMMRAAVD